MPVPLLVFLHGLGQNPPFWQDQVTALPTGTRAVAPWLEGLRPGKPGDFDLERAADAVLAQLNRFGVERVALAGTGLGAGVAVAAAGRAPGAVSHLVLSDLQPRSPKLAGLAQRLAVRAMPAGRLADAGLDRARMLRLVKAASGIDLRPWLGVITAKTLLISGASDAAGTAAARDLAAGLGDVRVEVIPGAAAPVPTQATEQYNRLLYDFLADA